MGIEMEKAARLPDPMVRNEQYYKEALKKIVMMRAFYLDDHPDYRIQVGADIAEYINEERQRFPNPDAQVLSSAIIERFDIMEAGFWVECYDAEFQEAWKKSDRTGRMIDVRPEVYNYFLERENRRRREQGLPPKTYTKYEDDFRDEGESAGTVNTGQ